MGSNREKSQNPVMGSNSNKERSQNLVIDNRESYHNQIIGSKKERSLNQLMDSKREKSQNQITSSTREREGSQNQVLGSKEGLRIMSLQYEREASESCKCSKSERPQNHVIAVRVRGPRIM